MRHKIVRGDGTTVLTPIMSFHYKAQSNQQENIRYGAAIPSYIEVEVFRQSGNMVSVGEQLTYYQVYDCNASFSPSTETQYKVGLYTVYECETVNKDTYKFIAYDNLKKLDADFSASLRGLIANNRFPYSCNALFALAKQVAGVTDSIPIVPVWSTLSVNEFYSDNITCRDICVALAELQGTYWICDSNGKITFGSYSNKSHTPFNTDNKYIICPTDQVTYYDPNHNALTPVFYKQDGLSQSDYNVHAPDAVKIIRSDGYVVSSASTGTENNVYYISGNIIVDSAETLSPFSTLATSILNNLTSNLSYSPPQTEVLLFPFRFPFSLGSVVYVEGTDGVRYQMPITNIDISDSDVLVGFYGTEHYVTVSGDYNTADQKTTSLDVRLNALKNEVNGKVSKSGDTMTGQLKTSFKNTIAPGTYQPSASTIPDLVEEVRFSSGCAGSVSIGTAYTKDNITIATGWYNFILIPHRSGGVNGEASGDNCNWGTLLLSGMTIAGSAFYVIRIANGGIAQLQKVTMQTDVNGKMSMTEHTISSVAVPANDTKNATVNVTKAGYYPYGIVGWHLTGTGSSYAFPVWLYLSARSSGAATINYCLRSVASNNHTYTFYVDVLWVKET